MLVGMENSPFSPSLTYKLMVSVDVKHHVYLRGPRTLGLESGAALAAAAVVWRPRWGNPNFPQAINEVLQPNNNIVKPSPTTWSGWRNRPRDGCRPRGKSQQNTRRFATVRCTFVLLSDLADAIHTEAAFGLKWAVPGICRGHRFHCRFHCMSSLSL